MNNLISQSVKVPHRSSHYLGYHNILTVPIGTLVPLCCQPLVPNTKVHLKTLLSASLAPLASDTFLRTSLKVEAFFCPMRLLYGGYEHWLTRDVVYPSGATQYSARLGVRIPCLSMSTTAFKSMAVTGSLADYLGIRLPLETDAVMDASDTVRLNYFPFAAYQYICDTWYNRADVQIPFFKRPVHGASVSNYTVNLPYVTINGSSASDYSVSPITLNATDNFFKLRQRNFPIDYFTSAMLSPQVGDAEGITIDTSGSSTQVSVASLRAANSLQVWRERIGLSGPRLVDYVRAHYGADLSDGNARRPMYLGSGSVEFYTRGVDQNAATPNDALQYTNNPFKTIGARYGNGNSNGEVSLIDNFIAEEPGYLMVMLSVVPKVTYSSGILRYLQHYTHDGCETDLANPILQNIGNQEINMSELAAVFGGETTRGAGYIFGYQQRYAEYMYREDECHGEFIDTKPLESFVSQRNITANTQLSSSFLEIPKTYLDQVSAFTATSTYGAMIDSYIDLSVSQPLFESSVPSLVNPMEEHGKNVVVMRGGKRII